jgi:RecB family exonuclease
LESIANYYYDILKTDSSSICFVFPSRRAGVFFTDYIKQQADQPLFAPRILTINDLFAKGTDLTNADQITLLFTLHQIYQQEIDPGKTFDEFIQWGEMILADFDDIDKYMVDAKDLFRNLVDYKMLDDDYSHLSDNQRRAIASFWGTFHLGRLSEHQATFIATWEKMNQVYERFRQTLRDQNIAYTGMIYRETAERIKQSLQFDNGTTHYAFIGFNALTESEHILFRYLQKQNRASFFWDYGNMILTGGNGGHINNGPGMFLHENTLRYPKPKDWNLPVNNSIPEITITVVAHPMEQSSEISRFLENDYSDNSRSAVILTDENMLLPVLYSLPDNIERVNVTMGYPLKNTPAYGLADLLHQLQKNIRVSASGTWFYHRNVLALLQHPYISLCAGKEADAVRDEMLKHNLIYLPAKSIAKNELLSAIFRQAGSEIQISKYMGNIIGIIFQSMINADKNNIQLEFVNSLYTALNRFDDILQKNSHVELTPETWFRLFKSIAEVQSVAFKGEPLAGLQVMGILETRAIDFEKLIILDMNEGIFPKTSAANTFIPYGLRVGFGLPTIEFQDSIFAYYFFRLIHRAGKVELLYSSSASGEMSRYLFQLIYQFNAKPQLRTAIQPVNLLTPPQLSVKKDSNVLLKLKRYLAGGESYLSPSAISQYIECQFKFYYDKIAGIAEPEEVSEEADARIFGKIFHQVLETYYLPLKNKMVLESTITHWIADTEQLDTAIRSAFSTQLGDQAGNVIEGKNLIIFEVIKNYIIQFFKNDKKETPYTFIDAERKIKTVHTTPSGLEVNIGGVIDRLHRKDETLHIIDYKTGSGESKIKTIEDLFDSQKHKDNKAVFQTMLYSMLTNAQSEGASEVQPGVSWMKNLFAKDYTTSITINTGNKEFAELKYGEYSAQYTNMLDNLIESIFDSKTNFEQTKNLKTCTYCIYKNLCNR